MILKIVENVSSKGIFHVVKTAVDLSIFSQLPFFNYNFLKLPQKLKKAPENGGPYHAKSILNSFPSDSTKNRDTKISSSVVFLYLCSFFSLINHHGSFFVLPFLFAAHITDERGGGGIITGCMAWVQQPGHGTCQQLFH